jgi:hypothetical protein
MTKSITLAKLKGGVADDAGTVKAGVLELVDRHNYLEEIETVLEKDMILVLKTALDANRNIGDKKQVLSILSLIIKLLPKKTNKELNHLFGYSLRNIKAAAHLGTKSFPGARIKPIKRKITELRISSSRRQHMVEFLSQDKVCGAVVSYR